MKIGVKIHTSKFKHSLLQQTNRLETHIITYIKLLQSRLMTQSLVIRCFKQKHTLHP